MGKKLMVLDVDGENKKWSFEFYGDPKYIEEWRKDGLSVNILENTIPVWVVDAGLIRPWCFFQDLINFKNPFSK